MLIHNLHLNCHLSIICKFDKERKNEMSNFKKLIFYYEPGNTNSGKYTRSFTLSFSRLDNDCNTYKQFKRSHFPKIFYRNSYSNCHSHAVLNRKLLNFTFIIYFFSVSTAPNASLIILGINSIAPLTPK